MMPDVRIRRLNLRVVRRGAPWATRDELERSGERARRAVLAELEEILGRALAGREQDQALGSLAIEVALGRGELGRAGADSARALRTKLEATLAEALRSAPSTKPATVAQHGSLQVDGRAGDQGGPRTVDASPAATLLALLLAWHGEGRLAGRLASLSEATAEDWLRTVHDALAARSPAPGERGFEQEPPVLAAPPARRTSPAVLAVATRSSCVEGLRAVIELAARWAPFRPPLAALSALLAGASAPTHSAPARAAAAVDAGRYDVASRHDAAREPAAVASTARSHERVLSMPAPSTGGARAARRLPDRAALATALPFLMLGPLARIDWLATAAALLAGRDDEAHALGFALALKALPIPARGWRHAPEQLASASAAAGLPEPAVGSTMVECERALGSQLCALDAVIADSLVRGHAQHMPLALIAAPQGLALVEPEGLFPCGFARAWDDLVPLVTTVGAPLLLDRSLAPSIHREIDAAGLSFVVEAEPARGEPWSRVTGPGGFRGMTNAPEPRRAALVQAAVRCSALPEEARQMLEALGPRRGFAPQRASGPLDRTLTLAAATAFGEISWRLSAIDAAAWAEPEPLLALQRFADLSATVTVGPERIEIRLPLGPRARDLAAAGLLADVDFVPWLDRPVRFGIG